MCNDIVLIALNDVYLNIVLARKLLVLPSGSLFFGNGSFSFFLHCHGYYKSSETSKVRTRKAMFHFIQLYVRFGGLRAEGFEEKKWI